MLINEYKVLKSKRSWRKYCRANDFDIDYAPKPEEYPCLLNITYPGMVLEYIYLRDIEKLRTAIVKAMPY